MLAWLDLETDGLDPQKNAILEIGFIITDDDLNEITRRAWVLPFNDLVSPFIAEMHGREKSGLLAECAAANAAFRRPSQMMEEMDAFLREHLGAEKPPLCGSSVDFDRGFLREKNVFAPLLDRFHYRVIDVSTVKEMARRWAPSVYESRPKPAARHRALPDLDDTIAEARHYKALLFDPEVQRIEFEKFESIREELMNSWPPLYVPSPEEIMTKRRELEQKKEGKQPMFKCFFCKQSSRPHDKLTLVVTRTRIVTTPEGREGVQIVEERARCVECDPHYVKVVKAEALGEADRPGANGLDKVGREAA